MAVTQQNPPAEKWDPPALNSATQGVSVDFLGSLHQVAFQLQRLNENIETLTHQNDAKRVLTVEDAAKVLKTSEQQVREFCAAGILTHARLGDSDRAHIRLALEDVLDFALNRRRYEAS